MVSGASLAMQTPRLLSQGRGSWSGAGVGGIGLLVPFPPPSLLAVALALPFHVTESLDSSKLPQGRTSSVQHGPKSSHLPVCDCKNSDLTSVRC